MNDNSVASGGAMDALGRTTRRSKALYPLLMTRMLLPVAARLSKLSIWSEFSKMLKTEQLDLNQLRQLQIGKMRTLLSHAYERVPFYRKRFEETGFRPGDLKCTEDIRFVPPTTKDDIMMHFPDEITAHGMDRSRWKYVATSGTTRQIMGIHDFRKANINWAAGIRAHKLAGDHEIGKKWMEMPPHMCTNICGINDSEKAHGLFSKKMLSLLARGNVSGLRKYFYQYAYSIRHDLYRRVTLPSFGSEGTNIPEQEMEEYIGKIRAYSPYLFEGLPLYLFTFAKHLKRTNAIPPPVSVIKPFGGSLTSCMKRTIADAFGAEVYDTYGCSETGFMACECGKHDGLHLFMDLYHVEVSRGGRPVAPGDLGRLYVTDLENRAMPWIRYDIGDVGRYYVDDHGCGRHSIRLQVEGRVQDTLVNSNGEFFTSDRIFDFFHGMAEIDNFQLVEKSKGVFELLCVPAKGREIDKEKVTREFRMFFDPEAAVKVFVVKTIKAEDGGKFRFVKSKSWQTM